MPNKPKEERGYRGNYQQIDSRGFYFCYKCQEFKEESYFDHNPGKWFRDCKDTRCKKCKSDQHTKRKIQNRGKLDLEGLLISRWYGARDRSKLKGYTFTITVEDLKNLWIRQNGLCSLSGIPMTFEFNNGRVPTNLSLDRIDANLGYTIDNIQLVCMAVNQMKSDLTMKQLLLFCTAIVNNTKKWKH